MSGATILNVPPYYPT